MMIKEARSFSHLNCLQLFVKACPFLIDTGLNGSIKRLEPISAYSLISRTFIDLADDSKAIKWDPGVIFDEVTKHPLFDNPMHDLLYLLFLVDYLPFLHFLWSYSVVAEIITDRDGVDLLSVYFRFAIVAFQEMH